MDELIKQVQSWAFKRGLHKADPSKQLNKLIEEVGELASGLNKNKTDVVIDGIGDVIVVLTILCMQMGLDLETCLSMAYDQIKHRNGVMVNGLFVKEEDL